MVNYVINCADDIFSVTAEGFETVPTVGQGVVVGAEGKIKAEALADTSVGKCIAIDVVDGKEFYVIEVL